MVPAGESFLYLTTRGRTTGRARQIEIWFVAHHGSFYMISELGEGAGWVQNLRAHAAVEFSIGTRADEQRDMPRTPAHARTVDDRAEVALAAEIRALMQSKYGWGDGLIVALQPQPHGP